MLDARMRTTPASRNHLLFETGHLRQDLRRRSVRGALVTMLGQVGRFVIQFAGVATLARLLLPADFGLFGKTVALTGFITVVTQLWILAAFVIAIRQALDYTSTLRAIAVCAIGWVIYVGAILMFTT